MSTNASFEGRPADNLQPVNDTRPDPGQDGANAPQEAVLTITLDRALALVRDELAKGTYDGRLTSADGLVDVAREAGVIFAHDTVTEYTLQDFSEACLGALRDEATSLNDPAFTEALIFAAAGQVDLNNDRAPLAHDQIHSQFLNPVQTYLAAIEYLDTILTNAEADQQFRRQNAEKFSERCQTDDWRAAVQAAIDFRNDLVKVLRTKDGLEILVGRASSTAAVMIDANRQIGDTFKTFVFKTKVLGQDLDLQNRIIPRDATEKILESIQGGDANPDTFVDKLFPASEYPDASIVANAQVEYTAAVLPLLPQDPEARFLLSIAYDNSATPYFLEIITGEKWHSRGRGLVNQRGGRAVIGPPSATSNEILNFSARAEEVLGERRKATAELVGEQASTSIVLVMKPVVSPSKASFRREVAKLKAGKLTAEEFARKTEGEYWDRDSLDYLQQRGIITAADKTRIEQTYQEIREERRRLEAERAAASAKSFDFSSIIKTSGGGAEFLLRSSGLGSDSGPSAFRGLFDQTRDSSPKGIDPAAFRRALEQTQRLHTGAGKSTGRRMGVATQRFEADPLAKPKILVIETFGINRAGDPDAARTVAATLKQLVSDGPSEN